MNSAYTIKKASFFKRILAFIFDLIILSFIFVGVHLACTQQILDHGFEYQNINNAYNEKLVEYNIGHYNEKTNKFEYNKLPEGKLDYDWTDFNKDEEAIKIKSKLAQLNFFALTLDFMLSELINYFIIPIILRNGQTLGKKLTKLALISTNEVKVKGWNIFARYAVGIFAFETMISLFFFNFFLIPLPLIISLIMSVFSKKGMALHDYVGGTIVVDLNNTIIIDTIEERRTRILEEQELMKNISKTKSIQQNELGNK